MEIWIRMIGPHEGQIQDRYLNHSKIMVLLYSRLAGDDVLNVFTMDKQTDELSALGIFVYCSSFLVIHRLAKVLGMVSMGEGKVLTSLTNTLILPKSFTVIKETFVV